MKIRMGHVSNSSSSSFIVGIGLVTNFEKFNKWRESIDEKEVNITLFDPHADNLDRYSDLIVQENHFASTGNVN